MPISDEFAAQTGPTACRIALRVVPGASREGVVGLYGKRLKVRVTAQPEEGRANRAVCEMLSRAIGVPTKRVTIIAGLTRPDKTARIEGCSASQVRAALLPNG